MMKPQPSIVASLIALTLLGLVSSAAEAAASRHSGVDLASMDNNVRIADDLFRHVNGNWLANTTIPNDIPGQTVGNLLADKSLEDRKVLLDALLSSPQSNGSPQQQIADLYASYLDQAGRDAKGLTPIQLLRDQIMAIDDSHSLATYFAKVSRLGGGAPFAIAISSDQKRPDSYGIYLQQSGLGLPARDYYLKNDVASTTLRAKYVQFIAAMLARSGAQGAAEQARHVLALETRIAALQWDSVKLRDNNLTYNKLSIAQLNQLLPLMDWQSYLTEAGIAGEAQVIVSEPDYLEKLTVVMKETSLADWQSYCMFHLLRAYAPYLDSKTRDLHFAFYGSTLSGIPQQREPWKQAMEVLDSYLGEAVGKLYVEHYFPGEAKTRMKAMVNNLITAYREEITQLDWMSAPTKEKALEKLAKVRVKIGYPEKWQDYSSIEIRPDDLVGNAQRAATVRYNQHLARLHQPVDREEWFDNPQTVNAYYNPNNNEIVFPAAILQPPYFDLQADDAINYGAIGAVIGHELSHGFDDQGAKFDGNGALHNWWAATDLTEFTARAQKLAKQYNRFEPIKGEHVNGQLTLGENIGDLGGLTIAHQAYQLALGNRQPLVLDGFTAEQRFFIGWAQVWKGKYRPEYAAILLKTDPHSPLEYRVNGVVANMPAFYRAFAIKPGDKLYLPASERVKIW
jgi:putative endopeptidase